TDVIATAGAMVFMGDYCVHTSAGLADADATQKFYVHRLYPHLGESDLASIALGLLLSGNEANVFYCGKVETAKHDSPAEAKFRIAAQKDLADAAWVAIAAKPCPAPPDK